MASPLAWRFSGGGAESLRIRPPDLNFDFDDVAQGQFLLWVGWTARGLRVYPHQAAESAGADDGCPERPCELGDPASKKPAAERPRAVAALTNIFLDEIERYDATPAFLPARPITQVHLAAVGGYGSLSIRKTCLTRFFVSMPPVVALKRHIGATTC